MNVRNLLLGFLLCFMFSSLSAQDGFNLDDLHEWSKGEKTNKGEEALISSNWEVNQKLKMGKKLFSQDQSHYLVVQNDVNLCIYTKADAFVWCSMSNGQKPDCYLVLQDDGHLCVYNAQDQFVWGSDTYKLESKPTSFYLENDGKLVLLDKNNNSVWKSH